MAKKSNALQTIQEWMERDLTLAALEGELAPAFEVEETLAPMADIIAATGILSGVGVAPERATCLNAARGRPQSA